MRDSREQSLERLVSRLEDIALHKHIAEGLYPKDAVYLEEIKQAIDFCARGDFDHPVTIRGEPVQVAILMTGLDLWEFALARRQAADN